MKNRIFQSFYSSSAPRTNIISAVILIMSISIIGVALFSSSNAAIKPLTPGTSWQWQLTGTVDQTVLDNVNNTKKMYDIDLFDNTASTVSTLKAKGITVVCYFSAGSAENWRSDYGSFPSSVKGNGLDGWPGETWLDVRNWAVLEPIMSSRMDLAVSKGCDGVEPDNVDGYTNNTGFPLTSASQITYNKNLASTAHAHGLSVALKNDVDQIPQLVNDFDWALNEECFHYNECGGYSAFINQNKAVFGVEYTGNISTFCPQANAANYDWLKKDLDLTATRTACREGNGSVSPPPPAAPTVTFSANPLTINSGGSSNLSWSSTNTTGCTASNAWSGTKAVSGNQSISPTSPSTYTLTCSGAGGSANKSVTISINPVNPPPTPPPAIPPPPTPVPQPSPRPTPTPTPSPPPAAGKYCDLNGDNRVDIFDLSIILSRYGGTSSTADINNDGKVDIFDLSILLSNYGK
jgi:hypothetical protein